MSSRQQFHHNLVSSRDCSWRVLFLLLAALTPAYGYTDPGTGLFLWQILSVAGLTCVFYARKIASAVKLLFRKKPDKSESQA